MRPRKPSRLENQKDGVARTERESLEKKLRKQKRDLRGGIKIYHQCGAATIELKPGPSRLKSGVDYKLDAGRKISEAQRDLFQHCAAYFCMLFWCR